MATTKTDTTDSEAAAGGDVDAVCQRVKDVSEGKCGRTDASLVKVDGVTVAYCPDCRPDDAEEVTEEDW